MSLSEAFPGNLSPCWPPWPSYSHHSGSVSYPTSQHLSAYSCQNRRSICSPLGKLQPLTCPSTSVAWTDNLPLCPLQEQLRHERQQQYHPLICVWAVPCFIIFRVTNQVRMACQMHTIRPATALICQWRSQRWADEEGELAPRLFSISRWNVQQGSCSAVLSSYSLVDPAK